MKIEAVCEYNQDGCLIYAENYPGAYVRGASEREALAKFGGELRIYLRWTGVRKPPAVLPEIEIVQRKESTLQICDADSDVLFDSERTALSASEYAYQKLLVLKSAQDFRSLFQSIPNPDISTRAARTTFYGAAPRTPREMYLHVNSVTAYYINAFGVDLKNADDIYVNRLHAFGELEASDEFLSDRVCTARDGELWTTRKLLRRFLWHDRIHAKAMWRTASALWDSAIENPFFFF